jgi:hypothetical protein
MPDVKIIGVHPLDVSPELFDQATTQQHGLIALDTDTARRERADAETRADLSRIVLVELVVINRDRRMYMGDFGQSPAGDALGPNDEVAYGETFLTPTGGQRIANYLDEVVGDDIRVAFFLHKFMPDRPILTTYGPVEPPPATEMPMRLKRLVEYKPR